LRRALPAFAAVDFLSCLLVVFVAVAVTSRPPQVKTYGSYSLTMTWPADPNDVDLYIRDPRGALCYYRSPQVDQMQLEHDDQGVAGTTYGAGTTNEERIVIREPIPGQYVVGARMFDRRQGTTPIPVSVELWDLQGNDRMLKARTIYLTKTGDMKTPFRFTLDAAGSVSGYSSLPANLLAPTTGWAS
jgi:hypothetical protein